MTIIDGQRCRLILYWTNPRSGSRVSRRRRAHDSQCAGCHRVNWIICRSRPIMAKVCAKKLSGESAKREVPDPVARSTQLQVAACSQDGVNPPDISITPKNTKPINPKFVPYSHWLCHVSSIAPPTEPCVG